MHPYSSSPPYAVQTAVQVDRRVFLSPYVRDFVAAFIDQYDEQLYLFLCSVLVLICVELSLTSCPFSFFIRFSPYCF